MHLIPGILSLILMAAAAGPEQTASYEGLHPGVFMKNWLACGPFPAAAAAGGASGADTLRRAFDRDFLAQHGCETGIKPALGLAHGDGGCTWRLVSSPGNAGRSPGPAPRCGGSRRREKHCPPPGPGSGCE